MKRQETILAAYRKPIKIKLINSLDSIKLNINKIARTNFVSSRKPLELLKEMPALKIARDKFFVNSKVTIHAYTSLKITSTKNILEEQSIWMKEMVAHNNEEIKNIAKDQLNRRFSSKKYKKSAHKSPNTSGIIDYAAYVNSNRIITIIMVAVLIALIMFTFFIFIK